MKILETLTDRFVSEGEAILQEGKVHEMCKEKLRAYLSGLCRDFGYDVETIEITFREMKINPEDGTETVQQ